MKMFVGNLTDQWHEFRYRIKHQDRVRVITIPPRRQKMLPEDLTLDQINEIVEHDARYGLVAASSISKSTPHHMAPRIYSIDEEVPSDAAVEQLRQNYTDQVKIGEERRKEAAIASGIALADTIEEQSRNTEWHGQDVGNYRADIEEQDSKQKAAETYDRFLVQEDKPDSTDKRLVKAGRRQRG